MDVKLTNPLFLLQWLPLPPVKSNLLELLQLPDPNGILIQFPLQIPHLALRLVNGVHQRRINLNLLLHETLQQVFDIILRCSRTEVLNLRGLFLGNELGAVGAIPTARQPRMNSGLAHTGFPCLVVPEPVCGGRRVVRRRKRRRE